MTNVTVSIDEQTFSLGMNYAQEHCISFDTLVTQSIEQTVRPSSKQWWKETLKLMNEAHGNSGGKRWDRAELHRG